MKTITNKLKKQIIEYCENNPIPFYWDYRESLDSKQIDKILSNENGLSDFECELYDYNSEYIWTLEKDFIEECLIPEFGEEITKQTGVEEFEIYDYLNENFMDYIHVNFSIDELLKNTGNLLCLIKVYSNYDCTNSFDTLETSDYLSQVYQRVKQGVKKSDFIYEHQNGAYGGSLFCFVFQASLNELIDLYEQAKTGKQIIVPKGTQFGFFSDFQGAGSCFDKTTYRNMKLNISETENGFNPKYDCCEIIADNQQNYTIQQVYGTDKDFAYEQNININ